jgi:signal peptidase I
MKIEISKLWKENKSFLLFLALMFVFRSSVADWNTVPTGSMKPTILEGDRILVNKLAYDVHLPFTHVSLFKIADPERGDIIVFDSKASGHRLVKRVIGVPGDRIALEDNVLTINGEQIAYEVIDSSGSTVDKLEDLLGVDHRIRVSTGGSRLSSFQAVIVPADYYLALGDNRDNSADSRVIGFIPRHEMIGRTERVVLSLNYENYYIPRKDRFFQRL